MPAQEWLEKYERMRPKTACPVDLNTYFECAEIAGKPLAVLDIGPCSLPSGRILVRDPLVYLGSRKEQPYFQTVPPGTYPVEVAVVQPDDGDCARYAAVRVRFSDKRPTQFYEALTGDEELAELEEEDYFGFCVDAGLGCICDARAHRAFCDWSEQWEAQHPDGNLYDGYFAPLFAASYRAEPTFQREGGDWLNWCIPGTDYHLPLFQTGFGDGVYPVYWGIAADESICQLVVQCIDIALAYGPSDAD